MQLERPGKCHFRPSGRFFVEKFSLYATRQPMVALRLDVAPPNKKSCVRPCQHPHAELYQFLNTIALKLENLVRSSTFQLIAN